METNLGTYSPSGAYFSSSFSLLPVISTVMKFLFTFIISALLFTSGINSLHAEHQCRWITSIIGLFCCRANWIPSAIVDTHPLSTDASLDIQRAAINDRRAVDWNICENMTRANNYIIYSTLTWHNKYQWVLLALNIVMENFDTNLCRTFTGTKKQLQANVAKLFLVSLINC